MEKMRYFTHFINLPKSISSIKKEFGKVYFVNQKNWESEISGRIVTDDEIDLGQVYTFYTSLRVQQRGWNRFLMKQYIVS